MKRFLISAMLCLAIVGIASSQPITTDKGKKSDETYLKLRKVDMLNQLLPLLLKKDQINRDLLPVIERARARQKQVLVDEDNELEKLDPEATEIIKNALEKNEYPKKDFITRVSAKTREMAMKRNIALYNMVEEVSRVVEKSFDAGQLKVMEGSFDAAYIDPTKKAEEITPAQKRGFFIRTVFLDPLAREMLIELAKYAK